MVVILVLVRANICPGPMNFWTFHGKVDWSWTSICRVFYLYFTKKKIETHVFYYVNVRFHKEKDQNACFLSGDQAILAPLSRQILAHDQSLLPMTGTSLRTCEHEKEKTSQSGTRKEKSRVGGFSQSGTRKEKSRVGGFGKIIERVFRTRY